MILIFDPFNGISGDMTVGALLDAGLPFEHLQQSYAALNVEGLEVAFESVSRAGVRASKFRVSCREQKKHRHLSHIEKMLQASSLRAPVVETALRIFRKLAEAEAAVHGTTIEKVHFHEVGALDSIADIVGAAVGFDYFKVERFFTHPVSVGFGMVKCEHGLLPVPPPATALLLRKIPTYAGTVESEMTTPTGAAILAALAEPMPAGVAVRKEKIGYGAGDRDFPGTPNVLRIFLSQCQQLPAAHEIVELHTNIDDMNPELYGPLLNRLLGAGALDVFYQPAMMKNGRPGTLVTVLCEAARREELVGILFRETTTLGIRYHVRQREVLNRRLVPVNTAYGTVRVKVADFGNEIFKFAPEFEDCRKIAEATGVPVRQVYDAAMAAYWDQAGLQAGTKS
ncbi:MAG TPA: nickel pincer cofactor biosynthesis protein LarC [Acidobacteriota bacterium]|jgi:hypothetical protein